MKALNTLFSIVLAFIIMIAWATFVRSQTITSRPAVSDKGWPRKFAVQGNAFSVYQPQIETWAENQLSARTAFSVSQTPNSQPAYGVVWFTARTEIDKVTRIVKLSNFTVTKVSFPSAPEQASIYQIALQSQAERQAETIALDRLLADMAINHAATNAVAHNVRNDPPKIFFSTRPSILILIDGNPEFRAIANSQLQQIINTRVLLVRDPVKAKIYLHLLDGWMEADNLMGTWSVASSSSNDLQKVLETTRATKRFDLLAGTAAGQTTSLKEVAKQNALPSIYVSTVPAELLQTQGEPQIASIANTQLVYVVNTESDIFVHAPTQNHYILVAGRWFRAASMNGPWAFVAGEQLPADFALIPATHSKASVLVSIPGTPQAKEALIANSIPQTATVKRSMASITVTYDGMPKFKSIEYTALEYAVNTTTPVIKVDSQTFYAVQNGVWFVGNTPLGPWAVATSVPTAVYSIPLSSPVHYVTYVKVYESTPDVVYVGYTPGYYGTVVTTANVVVYGSGWYYPPYIGSYYWYAAPYTYGYAAAFTWTNAYGWGVAATNVYGQWGNVAYSGTRAAWANTYTGNVGYGGVYSGTNTVTGTRYAARGGTNTNVYTGTTVTGGGAAAYNPNTGRISAGQAGVATNAYTGNSAAGARGATYNPQTGVISGGAVGGVRNGSTGQISAGGNAFAYNTNTNTGVAVANNNVYAGKDGNVYRYNPSTGVQKRTDGAWTSVQRQDTSWIQNQHQARSLGQQRTQNFSSLRGNAGSGGLRSGSGGGGGFRGLGGRRR